MNRDELNELSGLRRDVRVVVTDAFGDKHHGVITRGPERGPAFIKVWVRIDGRDDEIPWPVDAVRVEEAGRG